MEGEGLDKDTEGPEEGDLGSQGEERGGLA